MFEIFGSFSRVYRAYIIDMNLSLSLFAVLVAAMESLDACPWLKCGHALAVRAASPLCHRVRSTATAIGLGLHVSSNATCSPDTGTTQTTIYREIGELPSLQIRPILFSPPQSQYPK
jgi:hypothetical protein